MSSEASSLEVEGTVVEVLPNSVYRVALRNGHRIVAHASGSMRMSLTILTVGEKVRLEVSPYDLSQARILGPVSSPKD